jgi:hypothetical protein
MRPVGCLQQRSQLGAYLNFAGESEHVSGSEKRRRHPIPLYSLSLLLPSSTINRRAPPAHAPAHEVLFAFEWVAAGNKATLG